MTLGDSYDAWNGSFVDAMLPAYDYERKDALRDIMLDQGGFDEVEVHNLSGGIVALHRASKY